MRAVKNEKNMMIGAAIALLFLAACASGPPPPQRGVGSILPDITIKDQHGVAHEFDESVRLVLMSRDMDAGQVIKDALAKTGPEALERRGAVYVSDISEMPGLIARMVAIPKMRDRPYPMLLDRDGHFTASFPAQPGMATLLDVEKRKITQIRFSREVDEIAAALNE